jgi:hypothetical protein
MGRMVTGLPVLHFQKNSETGALGPSAGAVLGWAGLCGCMGVEYVRQGHSHLALIFPVLSLQNAQGHQSLPSGEEGGLQTSATWWCRKAPPHCASPPSFEEQGRSCLKPGTGKGVAGRVALVPMAWTCVLGTTQMYLKSVLQHLKMCLVTTTSFFN